MEHHPTNKLEITEEEDEENENIFFDRPFEEVEGGYIDDRGFYVTPNGSFWDEDHNYFNHFGFNKYGGSYDKYGVYHPGSGYDEKTGLYKEQKELISSNEINDTSRFLGHKISRLKEQEKTDEKTIKKYEILVEDSEESDEEDKSNVSSYDEDEIKEAYENAIENENNNTNKNKNKTTKTKIQTEIQKELFAHQDKTYRELQIKILPSVVPETIIGVRTPELRKMAKQFSTCEDINNFLENLPHKYFEENQIHSFIISEIKNFDECLKKINLFLPYIDNWATSDQLIPKIFKKNKKKLISSIKKWINSKKTYSVRFGIKMLMDFFLDDDFNLEYPKMVSSIKTEEYYIKMMIAWYFSTALIKQYDSVIPFIENKVLEPWTHNKAIQKSVESFRVTSKQKEYLKTLKIKTISKK